MDWEITVTSWATYAIDAARYPTQNEAEQVAERIFRKDCGQSGTSVSFEIEERPPEEGDDDA